MVRGIRGLTVFLFTLALYAGCRNDREDLFPDIYMEPAVTVAEQSLENILQERENAFVKKCNLAVEEMQHERLLPSAGLSVPEVLQMPELPTGCESVSLTMVLMYEGFHLKKTTITDWFLPYDSLDFVTGYAGDPETVYGAGCFPPAIVTAANEYLETQKSDLRAVDLTGESFDRLLYYVSRDCPIMVWGTMYMAEPDFTDLEILRNGITYTWYTYEHCVVLSGYDLDLGVVTINDPLEGVIKRDLEEFKEIYDEVGQFAVILEK